MRIVFMGTPDFAVPSLVALNQAHDVRLVVTRPDAIRGRGKKLLPSAVKAKAEELGLEVREAKRISPELLDEIKALEPDIIAVAAFGCILPDALLEVPKLDTINVHASTLPKLRGAAPVPRAILEGHVRAGISIMRIVHELDAGAYCRQADTEIADKCCPELFDELADLGARELLLAIDEIAEGKAKWTEQDESQVTFAAKIDKAEILLDPADTAAKNLRRVQASQDSTPARTLIAERGLRVLKARVSDEKLEAGQVKVTKNQLLLGCAEKSLELLLIKPDGKREMAALDWARGLHGELSWSHI